MDNTQLYTKLSGLPLNLQFEVSEFIDFLKFKSQNQNIKKLKKRVAGKAKGLIEMKDNFEAPIEGFNEYLQ